MVQAHSKTVRILDRHARSSAVVTGHFADMASTQLVRWDTNVVSRGFKTRCTRHTTIVSQGIQTCILSGFCAGFTCIPRDSTLGSCLYPQGRLILFPQGYKPYPGMQFCVPSETNCILTSKGYCFVSLGYNKGGADVVRERDTSTKWTRLRNKEPE